MGGMGGTAGHLISFQSHTGAPGTARLNSVEFHEHRNEDNWASAVTETQPCDPSMQPEMLFGIYTEVTFRQAPLLLEPGTTSLIPTGQDQLSAAMELTPSTSTPRVI